MPEIFLHARHIYYGYPYIYIYGYISCKDGHYKGQKWYGPNRSRRYILKVARIYRKTIQKRSA